MTNYIPYIGMRARILTSIALVRATMHIPRLFLAIVSISFFWTIGAVLFIQFPPLVKNVLTADRAVASLFLAIFSIGVAIGSVAINRLLKGEVSARYSAPAVIAMGLCVVGFHLTAAGWEGLPATTSSTAASRTVCKVAAASPSAP